MHESHIHFYNHALGYEKSNKKSCRSYKILNFNYEGEYKLYYFNSDSWRVVDDVTQNEYTNSGGYCHGISLKGNTYWFFEETFPRENGFLVCFDFTKESFSPPFPLPFECSGSESVALSSVRDEQLAVLIQQHNTLEMEIWVTNKIEPNAVSWRSKSFLAFNMNSFDYIPFSWYGVSFFIDEEKKIAVIFDDKTIDWSNYTYDIVAYIVGVDGSYKEMNLGESEYKHRSCQYWSPPVCSYVPSLVHLN